jgi:hypothetical protein
VQLNPSRLLRRIVSGQEGCDHAKHYDVKVKARGCDWLPNTRLNLGSVTSHPGSRRPGKDRLSAP